LLRQRLGERPELAAACIRKAAGYGGAGELRSRLHVVTDWPGHFPNGPATVAALIGAGADVMPPVSRDLCGIEKSEDMGTEPF